MKQKIYPGWWIVLTGVVLMGMVYAPMLTLPGVFTVPVTGDFGISRTTFNLHISICSLSSTVAAVVGGKAFDKYSPRALMSFFAVLTGLCFGAYSFATNVYHFYVISAVFGFAGRFLSFVPVSILVTNWFGPRLKGKVMGVAMAGSGLGAVLLNPLLSATIARYSWQAAYRLLALLTFLLVLPLVVGTVIRSPADRGLPRLGDEPQQGKGAQPPDQLEGLRTDQALRSGLFWAMFGTFCLFSIACTIFNNNAIPSMVDCGLDAVTAATVMSISAFGIVVGKLLLGAISDRWNAKTAASVSILCLMAGLGLFLLLPRAACFLLAAAGGFLFGVGNANCTVCMPLITSDLMGNRAFAQLFSYASVASSLGATVGPLVGSLVFDRSGSYSGAWLADLALSAFVLCSLHLCYRLRGRAGT